MTDIPIEYDQLGRMKYHPEFHDRHKKPWTTTEEKYLIDNYVSDGPEAVSLSLGRTVGVIMTRAYELRQEGKMPAFVPGGIKHKRVRAT